MSLLAYLSVRGYFAFVHIFFTRAEQRIVKCLLNKGENICAPLQLSLGAPKMFTPLLMLRAETVHMCYAVLSIRIILLSLHPHKAKCTLALNQCHATSCRS